MGTLISGNCFFAVAVDLRRMTVYLAGLLSLILSQVLLVRKESYLPEGGPTSRNRIRAADVTAQWNEGDDALHAVLLRFGSSSEKKKKLVTWHWQAFCRCISLAPGSPSAFALTKLAYCTHRDFSRRTTAALLARRLQGQ